MNITCCSSSSRRSNGLQRYCYFDEHAWVILTSNNYILLIFKTENKSNSYIKEKITNKLLKNEEITINVKRTRTRHLIYWCLGYFPPFVNKLLSNFYFRSFIKYYRHLFFLFWASRLSYSTKSLYLCILLL